MTVFFGVVCSLLGVRGLGLGVTVAVTGFTPYFFGGTNRLGDCRFLVVAGGGVGLKKKQ